MSAWSDAEIGRVQELIAGGHSGAQIAARISVEFERKVSRNAVISLIHRRIKRETFAGLSARPGPKPSTMNRPVRQQVDRSKMPVTERSAKPSRPASARPSPARQPDHTDLSGKRTEPTLFVRGPAAGIVVVPMAFSRALDEGRCLFFAADPMIPGGPDMPVCGCLRQTVSRKPYCQAHLIAEVSA